ncbi:MAG: hypothetical protein IJ233_05820 [Pyramidobacter sp.]|nr:hypothetical protein [Pyramidobacter sp.]
MDKKNAVCAAFLALIAFASAAPALTVGTFNTDGLSVVGTLGVSRSAAYDQRSMRSIAGSCRKSRAAVLALQGVEGNATLRYLTVTAMQGWKYAGNDTSGASDLFFLWDPRAAELKGSVRTLGKTGSFSRAPIAARFRDTASGKEYTLVNALLDDDRAELQMVELCRLVKAQPMPAVLLGSFGPASFPADAGAETRSLKYGFSCDDSQTNPDFIGVWGLPADLAGAAKETETAIRSKSKRREHPAHDIVTVELRG